MEPANFWYLLSVLVLIGLVVAIAIVVTRKNGLQAAIDDWTDPKEKQVR